MNKLIVSLCALGLLVGPPARGAEGSCQPLIQACDKALADQDRVINLKTRAIEVHQDIILAQDTRIRELEKDKTGLFSSPWFYFGIGVVAGAFIVRGR